MKLSQAMLKGCEMCPGQTYGELFRFEGKGKRRRIAATCALGAVILADVGHEEVLKSGGAGPWVHVWDRFNTPGGLTAEIVRRNDWQSWTREQIAAWLDRKGW